MQSSDIEQLIDFIADAHGTVMDMRNARSFQTRFRSLRSASRLRVPMVLGHNPLPNGSRSVQPCGCGMTFARQSMPPLLLIGRVLYETFEHPPAVWVLIGRKPAENYHALGFMRRNPPMLPDMLIQIACRILLAWMNEASSLAGLQASSDTEHLLEQVRADANEVPVTAAVCEEVAGSDK